MESTTLDYSDMSLAVVPRSDIFDWTTYVDLSSDLINSVEDYDFANLPQLKTIKINKNNIGSISKLAFENSTSITQLNFQNNKVSCLCDFSHLQIPLENLFLENNPLQQIVAEDFTGFPVLRLLQIKNTNQQSYPNTTFVASTLKTLSLGKNPLGNIDPKLLATSPNLITLEVTETQLTNIPDITQLPANNNILVLTLSNNKFDPILGASDFANLHALNTVSIQDTDLAEFPDFGDAKASLGSLFLARNKITVVDPVLLQAMPKIIQIYLTDNLLTTFPDIRSLVPGPVTALNLFGNSLVCDAVTTWIGSALANGDITTVSYQQ